MIAAWMKETWELLRPGAWQERQRQTDEAEAKAREAFHRAQANSERPDPAVGMQGAEAWKTNTG